jgi:hypothetical protein
MKVGDRFLTKNYGEVEVVEYIDSRICTVMFKDGTTIKAKPYNVRNGAVKNPNQPKEGDFGFIGIGEEKAVVGGKATYAYVKWLSMMSRCYKRQEDKYRFYLDCSVDMKWHNFQNFSKWIKQQKGYGQPAWHIDKDLLVKNNTLYSEEYCVLIPQKINLFLLRREKDRGECPIGVTFNKERGLFHAQLSTNGKQKVIGIFNSPEEAFACYKQEKETEAKRLAGMFKSVVEERVYDALMNFTVDIND